MLLMRDTYLEVNLDSIAHNVRELKKRIGPNAELCAVVKANGYGAGAVEVAPTIVENGAYYLAVAALTEALELREHYADYRVLVMGYTPTEYLRIAVNNNIALTIFTYDQAEALDVIGRELGRKPIVHIKYNTGMNRLGFDPNSESIDEIMKICKLQWIEAEGFFSHFALINAEEDEKQFTRMTEAIEKLKLSHVIFRFRHICDGISTINNKQFHLNMVRPGAPIYGIRTFGNADIDIRHALTMKSRIYQIRTLKKGDTASYMKGWVAERDSVVATLPLGYADGIPKSMGNNGCVTVRGQRAGVLGWMCMDQCIIDITDIPDASVGDEVIIFGNGENNTNTLRDIALAAETGQNDIITRMARRVPRVYYKNGQVYKIKNYLLGKSYE